MHHNTLRIVDDTNTMNKGIFEMQKSIFAAIAERMQKRRSSVIAKDKEEKKSIVAKPKGPPKRMKNFDTFRYLK